MTFFCLFIAWCAAFYSSFVLEYTWNFSSHRCGARARPSNPVFSIHLSLKMWKVHNHIGIVRGVSFKMRKVAKNIHRLIVSILRYIAKGNIVSFKMCDKGWIFVDTPWTFIRIYDGDTTLYLVCNWRYNKRGGAWDAEQTASKCGFWMSKKQIG